VNDALGMGKQIIITGPTSGVGKEIAAQLASLGANLVLGCRDVGLGEQTALEIANQTGAKNISVMQVDTSSRQSIRNFAQNFRNKHSRLDVLINNAGLNRAKRQLSVDGIELTFATNVLGYFLLTCELLDCLKASAPSRVINMASSFAGELDLDDLQFERRPYEASKAYSQSKACDRMLTRAFARRLYGSGVTFNSMAPGLMPDTGLYRESPPELVARLRKIGGRTVAEGANTAVWLASSPRVQGTTGKFFELRHICACEFRNKKAEEKLWDICEQLVAKS
jgi:NAD(P)-dependent dehydrogenase (short-subunit alcohol dehydrogenase family)